MPEVKIQQVRGGTFAARAPSNHWTIMDVSKDKGGEAAASSPMEMVLFGLGGCTGVDVDKILKKMKLAVENFEIDIFAERADNHPKVFTSIEMIYHFYGKNLPLAKLERAVKLSKDTYCSVSAMLAATVKITAKVENHNTA